MITSDIDGRNNSLNNVGLKNSLNNVGKAYKIIQYLGSIQKWKVFEKFKNELSKP